MKLGYFISAFFLRLFMVHPYMPLPNISTNQAIAMREIVKHFHSQIHVARHGTENGLDGPCRKISFIYARGSAERGNVGDLSSPGPPWISEMRKAVGDENIAVQGLNYEARTFGYFVGGDPKGSKRLLKLIRKTAKRCPDTKIVLGGYSQGAQLVHNADTKLSDALAQRIVAVVLFGDPYGREPFENINSSSVLEICHKGDVICSGKGGFPAHLTYDRDNLTATAFVTERLRLKS